MGAELLRAAEFEIRGREQPALSAIRNVRGEVRDLDREMGRATTRARGMDRAVGRVGRGGGRLGLTNVAFQVQDIAVQLRAGTDASVAFGQNLPQLLGAFGLLGAAAGAVVAIFGPMGIELAQNAFGLQKAAEPAKAYTDSLAAMASVMSSLRDRTAEANAEIGKQFELTGAAVGVRRSALLGEISGILRDLGPDEGVSPDTVRLLRGLAPQFAGDAQIGTTADQRRQARTGRSSGVALNPLADDALRSALKSLGEVAGQLEAIDTSQREAAAILSREAEAARIKADDQASAGRQRASQAIGRQAEELRRARAEIEGYTQATSVLTGAQTQLASGLSSTILEGKRLSDVFGNLARTIADAAIQASVLGAFFGSGPWAQLLGSGNGASNSGSGQGLGGLLGDLVSPLFSGARAYGGSVTAGRTYLVGENGPEPFTPNRSGVISPNGVLQSGGGTNVEVHIHNAPEGTEVRQGQGRVDVFIRDAVNQYLQSGGGDRVLSNRYGLRPRALGA